MKFCEDCKFHRRDPVYSLHPAFLCEHPTARWDSTANGNGGLIKRQDAPHCRNVRKAGEVCGPDGDLFESKPRETKVEEKP